MAQEIVIDVDRQGNVNIEGINISGRDCTALTKDLEAALGDVTKRELKPEFHQTVGARRSAKR